MVQAYPEWKLLFLDGWEENVHHFVRQGIQEYVAYWNRYKDNPSHFTFDSIEEGLRHIDSGQNIMIINEPQLLGHLKLHPTSQGRNSTKTSFVYVDPRCLDLSTQKVQN